jgi:cytochrome d ubiquinol oxidase subunit I
MVARQQPAKLAAFEGHFETGTGGTPLYLAGWPDEANRTVQGGIAVPGMLSFLVHWDFRTPVRGLSELEGDYGSPPVWLAFQTYHVMVGLGMLFLVSTLYASWCWWRGTLFQKRWLLWFFVFAVGLAFVANETGWMAAEIGRQPWIVYPTRDAGGNLVGGLLTRDGVSEVVTREMVWGSIILFAGLYALLFVLWVYLLDRAIKHGPPPIPLTRGPIGKSTLLSAAAARTGGGGSLGKSPEEGR